MFDGEEAFESVRLDEEDGGAVVSTVATTVVEKWRVVVLSPVVSAVGATVTVTVSRMIDDSVMTSKQDSTGVCVALEDAEVSTSNSVAATVVVITCREKTNGARELGAVVLCAFGEVEQDEVPVGIYDATEIGDIDISSRVGELQYARLKVWLAGLVAVVPSSESVCGMSPVMVTSSV